MGTVMDEIVMNENDGDRRGRLITIRGSGSGSGRGRGGVVREKADCPPFLFLFFF